MVSRKPGPYAYAQSFLNVQRHMACFALMIERLTLQKGPKRTVI